MHTTIMILLTTLAVFHSFCLGQGDGRDSSDNIYEGWQRYVESLLPAGKTAESLFNNAADPRLSAELYDFMFSQVAAGYVAWMHADPQYPDFWPTFGQLFDQAIPNPDFVYHLTPVDEDGVYKISGFRGSVYIVDIQLASGLLIPRGIDGWGSTLENFDLDTLDITEDGSFDVVFSKTRPENYRGQWRELAPGTTYILMRQISYDWLNEVDGRFAIERLDRPAIKPRSNADDITANLEKMSQWVENWTRTSMEVARAGRETSPANGFSVKNWYTASGGLSSQQYMEGSFTLAPDEALILEAKVPETCRYWSFHLADELWRTLDAVNHQSSLNGHTALLDEDGIFRAVISAKDPGVPNWIDTLGYERGLIYGRWKDCGEAEQPVTKKVNIADVRQHLPDDTPVISAEARDQSIRLRRKGAQLRRRW